MKKRKKIYSVFSFLLAGTLCLSMAACGGTPTPAEDETTSSAPLSGALPVKALQPKHVDENPYMAKSDANIHHDGYNTDSTDEILPLGIYPEINVSFETTNPNASPAIYFDNYGHAVVPLLGGIAIRDLNATETKTLGYFSPMQHDGGGYVIQSSYTFLDSKNRVVCPTSNNHVLILRTTEEDGSVIPEFEKVLDIDIKAAAETALGKELTQNLLSVVFDYDGNLWFATGGFRIYPQRQQQGVIGYIARSAIDAILNGEQTDLSKAVFVHELTPGEGAENGIAASKDGAVVLTNQNCYLLRAEEGVDVVWCTPYTAKLLYALLLDRATLSRKNNWTDEQGRIYVVYPIPKLAQTLGCSFSSITRSLTELTNAGLIERTRSGFSKPSRIFLKIPHTAQKCAATLRISGSSDCAEMTNMIVQKCPPNYLNKNKLSFNHPTEQRNVPLYEFREGESL